MNGIFVERLKLGGDGPRVAVKDTIDVAGFPTRAGSRALADAPAATQHADVVQTLIDAGCRLVGKTTLHELAFGVTGLNAHAGTAPNPRFPDCVPGGSSSGSAAAVAAGLAEFALGTDTGGSVRVPAACCGVYGLKPTYGRISRRGVLPADSSLDCVGVFAAEADTLGFALQLLDPSLTIPSRRSGFRLGWVDVPARAEVSEAVRRAAVSSAELTTVSLPGLAAAFMAGLVIINRENWQAFAPLLERGTLGSDVQERLRAAAGATAEQQVQAEAVRAGFTAEVDAALQSVDALVLPTMPDFPLTLREAAADPRAALGITSLVRPFNLSGHPALSIPLMTAAGLPAGLQLVTRKGEDGLLCRLAQHIEHGVPAVIRTPATA